MRYRDKKRLSLKMFIFCSLYTLLVLFVIYYSGSKITTATTNITNVKSIESFRMKTKEEKDNNYKGILEYINNNSFNCLDNYELISNDKYKDSKYGEVLLLKTNDYYSCYSIIKMSTSDNQYFYGIVLNIDKELDKNTIQIIENKDFSDIEKLENITYNIERFGN